MPLERLLQINMAAFASLGALLLGMGARSEGPPLVVVVATALSVWLTDVTGRFAINRRVSRIIMVLAAVFALQDLFWVRSELHALNFAWLVIVIQVTLSFQRKDGRTYWLLILLSLLQVVIATLFSQGIWFGLLLAVYMLVGFSAMTLLLLYRQWELFGHGIQGSWASSHALSDPIRGNSSIANAFTSHPADGDDAALGPDLFRRLGVMGVQTLGLTLVLFFALPRFGQLSWQRATVNTQPLVGFSDKVALGELGQIMESREEVMRLQFETHPDGTPQPVHGDIYLQSALLIDYSGGQWDVGKPSARLGTTSLLRDALPGSGVVREKIAIEAMDHDHLFFVSPYLALQSNSAIDIDCAHERLTRNWFFRNRRFEYTLGTTAIVHGEQSPLTRVLRERMDLTPGTKTKPNNLPNLSALARRWIKESGLPEQDRVGRAHLLEQRLSASDRFQYSLIGQERDVSIDPIEDFVTKHPRGHCEYFATALTLMLRSQGIPARMVCGYKIDHEAWDDLGKYYLVRQFHAHAWVEAYLGPSQVPAELKHGDDCWHWKERGGWLRLDPTPAGAADQRTTWFSPVRRTMDWLDSAWSNYFVELDCQRQRDAIYQPIAKAATSLWQNATSQDRWRAIFNSVTVALYLNHLSREVVWLLLIVAGLLLSVLLAAFGWLLTRLARRLFAGRRVDHSPGLRRRVEIEFYRRFEALLSRQRIVRLPGQTQREFAAAAGPRLASLGGDGRLADLPHLVVEAFYRVRFGAMPLDNLQSQTVELALAKIAAVKPGPRVAKP